MKKWSDWLDGISVYMILSMFCDPVYLTEKNKAKEITDEIIY